MQLAAPHWAQMATTAESACPLAAHSKQFISGPLVAVFEVRSDCRRGMAMMVRPYEERDHGHADVDRSASRSLLPSLGPEPSAGGRFRPCGRGGIHRLNRCCARSDSHATKEAFDGIRPPVPERRPSRVGRQAPGVRSGIAARPERVREWSGMSRRSSSPPRSVVPSRASGSFVRSPSGGTPPANARCRAEPWRWAYRRRRRRRPPCGR